MSIIIKLKRLATLQEESQSSILKEGMKFSVYTRSTLKLTLLVIVTFLVSPVSALKQLIGSVINNSHTRTIIGIETLSSLTNLCKNS